MRLILSFFVTVFFTTYCFGQEPAIIKKNISDTVLRDQRKLIITSDSLDAMKVMLKLFPGKFYNIDNGNNIFISWECKTCKPILYADANDDEGQQFPYEDGVFTKLIAVINYKDTKGSEFKILAFDHSPYDGTEQLNGRATSGLLGLAKFAKSNGSWQMRTFQPAIAAFGSFGRCPDPVPILIGEDQYALTIDHINGGAGGPFLGSLYLIAGNNGKYRPILTIDQYGLESHEGVTSWESTIKVDNESKKQYYRDIIITTRGQYHKLKFEEDDPLLKGPDEMRSFTKNKKSLRFVIEKRYAFDGKQYVLKGKPVVTITNAK